MMRVYYKWLVMIFACITSACPACFGQSNMHININAGWAITRLWNSTGTGTNAWFFKTAPAVGIAAYKQLNDVVALQGELNYDVIKSRQEGLLLLYPNTIPGLPGNKNYYAYVQNNISLQYMSVGFLIRFYFDAAVKMYVEGGPFFSVLAGSHLITSGKSMVYLDAEAKEIVMPDGTHPLPEQTIYDSRCMRNQFLPINAGAITGIGMQLPIVNKRCGISARYAFGVLNINKGPLPGGSYKTDQLQIRVSYRIR